MEIIIRNMKKEDYQEVKKIYQTGINSHQCTFETRVPSWEEWDQAHLDICRFIAMCRDTHQIIGFAALTPMSSRWCFRGVAEVSIYLNETSKGQGIGTCLLMKLIRESEKHGIWSLYSGIFPENTASIKLHEKCGFRFVGVREKLGEDYKGTYRDVVFYERRSIIVG